MVLQQLQALLVRLYDIPGKFPVTDFLVTDPQCLPRAPNSEEELFVAEQHDMLRMSVYIDTEVLRRLGKANPCELLSDDNLSDYCIALEGVSHFHYLAWRASHGQPVSLLELELQAEVDKYAAALLLFTRQQSGRFPHTLHERLFHSVRFDAKLNRDDLQRYRTANRCAARFCRQLDDRFLKRRRSRPEAWLEQLRRFYRMTHRQKLSFAMAGG